MEPLFKVGNKVTIKDIRNDSPSDYPCSFVREMSKYKNQSFEITDICPAIEKYPDSIYYDKFDGFVYSINCPGNWCWSSPMFQETYEL